MRVLVTGGAGFIGSRVVPLLRSSGAEISIVDNLSVGLPPPEASENVAFHLGDVRDCDFLRDLCDGFRPDAVIHLAAIHHIPTCENDPATAVAANVHGFQCVLDAAERVSVAKVILASSGAVYDWGEGPLQVNRSNVKPRDVYSFTKYSNELQLSLWSERTGATGVAARIFNTIGKNDPNAHLIPEIVAQMGGGVATAILRLGNVHTKRDYIAVDDTASCLTKIAQLPLTGMRIFNVGTGKEHSVAEIVKIIARIKGVDCRIEKDPARVRKIDRLSQLADIDETVRCLAWTPRYELEEALRLALE